MTTHSDYLSNPLYQAQLEYVLGPPNGGHYKRWIQGSPGMMSGMPIVSNEYNSLIMKHGSNNLLPYRGSLQPFSQGVTPSLEHRTAMCTQSTLDPVGCQEAAIRKVFSEDTLRNGGTPQPFGVSYNNGRHISRQTSIPPNHMYQD